jgi:hypothetical protein
VLGITEADLLSFKTFLQKVENMNLKIDNLITYISRGGPEDYSGCLKWTIDIGYSL